MNVLVVDDNLQIRQGVSDLLSSVGIVCDTAEDGVDAIHCLEKKSYGLVVTDIDMPRKNGIELALHIREHYPEISVIGLSGSVLTDHDEGIFDAFFRKGLSTSSLMQWIEQFMKKKGKLSEKFSEKTLDK